MLSKETILGTKQKQMTEKELELAVRQKNALAYLYSKNKKRYGLFGFSVPNGDELYTGIEFKPTIMNFIKGLFGFARKSTILFTYLIPYSVDSWAASEMIKLGLTDATLEKTGNWITHNNPYGNMMDKLEERNRIRKSQDPDAEDIFFEEHDEFAKFYKNSKDIFKCVE